MRSITAASGHRTSLSVTVGNFMFTDFRRLPAVTIVTAATDWQYQVGKWAKKGHNLE